MDNNSVTKGRRLTKTQSKLLWTQDPGSYEIPPLTIKRSNPNNAESNYVYVCGNCEGDIIYKGNVTNE